MRTSYEERIRDIKDTLRRLGRAATVAELFEELKRDSKFGTPRRIAATVRWDKRQRHPVFIRQGIRIAIRRSI